MIDPALDMAYRQRANWNTSYVAKSPTAIDVFENQQTG